MGNPQREKDDGEEGGEGEAQVTVEIVPDNYYIIEVIKIYLSILYSIHVVPILVFH